MMTYVEKVKYFTAMQEFIVKLAVLGVMLTLLSQYSPL